MNLQQRIDLLGRLGQYILSGDDEWKEAKNKAALENGWFIPPFIDLAANHIANLFLNRDRLTDWASQYHVPANHAGPVKTVGIVMAGNIPLVGFHDLLCVLVSGHRAHIKPSSKDSTLIKHLVFKLSEWDPAISERVLFSDNLIKNCDAYIATGSNNTAGYFQQYFGKYHHLIRRNRTSVAVLRGNESLKDLEALADDVYLYFGLGCRNVTKLYVPRNFNFEQLLSAFRKYHSLADHHKYRNNLDYNLALLILNKQFYMSNESLLLVENTSLFSPISQLHYEFYDDSDGLAESFIGNTDLQCVIGKDWLPFGSSQQPSLADYADRVDTMKFLSVL